VPNAPTATTATPVAAVARQNPSTGRRPATLVAVAVLDCSAMAKPYPARDRAALG
jgi:hypothetical protein